MTIFKRTVASILLLVCLLSLASCAGDDTGMDDLVAIRAKLTAKGYQANITAPVEISIVNQLEATHSNGASLSVVLFRDEQSAICYYEIMKGQVEYYIAQNEQEAQYLSHMVNTYGSEMSADEITEAEGNVAYFQKCADDTRKTVCVRHGKAVVMATTQEAYEDCK